MTQRSKNVTKVQYLKWSGLGEIMTVEDWEKVYSHWAESHSKVICRLNCYGII